MQKKKGISLIVLVITIIVMIILAAAIIISLNNAGIIGKANDAVEQTNLRQVQQLASIAWADAYSIGKTSQAELEEYVLAVLEENKVNKDKYIITVTPEGVDVELKENVADAMNEYGFYFERAYVGTFMDDGGQITAAYVFHQDGSAEAYAATPETNNILFCTQGIPRDSLSYANKSISMGDQTGTVSPDGLSITMDGVTLSCTSLEIHGGYRNKIYSVEVEGLGTLEAVLSNNNVATLSLDGETINSLNVTITAKDHLILYMDNTIGMLSIDGKQLNLYVDDVGMVLFTLDEDSTPVTPGGSAEHPYVNSEWEVAWAYKNGAWSGRIAKDGDATGDIVAKLYPTGKKVKPVAYDPDDILMEAITATLPEDTAYAMVIEGSGDMPSLYSATYDNDQFISEEAYAWQQESLLGMLMEKYETAEPYYVFYITDVYITEGITSIGEKSLTYMPSLKNINISTDVKKIDEGAFAYSGMTNITLPSGLMQIGKGAFSDSAITTINIPNSVSNIGEKAFEYCSQLTNITLPSNITEISPYMFNQCESLSNIVIPDNVTKIGENAFKYSGISYIDLPNNLRTIDDSAFESCSSLTSISIPSNVASIGTYAFSNSGLTSITIPASVTDIGASAFRSCSSLTSIDFNARVTNIPDYCFYQCTGLTSITIPDSVTDIGASAFGNCTSLKTVNILSMVLETDVSFNNIATGSTIYVPKGSKDSLGLALVDSLKIAVDTTKITVVER